MGKIFLSVMLLLVISSSYGQVNLQTGSATFSLPMFNWQDDKSRLNSIVALSYNSGNGLKVNDVASNVGQGWSMVAGGVISRIQVGEPDDQPAFAGNKIHTNPNGSINQDYIDQDITKYPAGYLYAVQDPAIGCPDALRKYPIYKSMNQLYSQHNEVAEDKQLDYFSFQFNGKSGMFVLQKPSPNQPSNTYVGIPLGDTKMKISFQLDPNLKYSIGARTTISSFTITDVDGLIYTFAQLGLTKVLKSGFSNSDGKQAATQPKIENVHAYHQSAFDDGTLANPFVVSNWYLTEITDPLITPARKITFTYGETRMIDARAGEDISFNNSLDKYVIVTYKRSIVQTPAITAITYPDGHNVTFNYGALRADFQNDKVLSSVDIKYQGRFLSKYQLNTTYFLKNRYGTPKFKYQQDIARLCLKSVTKIGPDLKEDSPPYIFDYYLGSNAPDDFVPPPFFYEKDIWGCYNGSNSIDYYGTPIPVNTAFSDLTYDMLHGLCLINNDILDQNGFLKVNLNAKPGYAKNGLLKQIVYPTGGSLTYAYEQNTGKLDGVNTTNVGGVHVSQTSSADGGYSNGCDNPVVTHYNYVLEDGSSSLWGIEMPINHSWTTNTHYEPEWKYWEYFGSGGWNLFGKCTYHFIYPGILSAQQSINLSTFQTIMNAVAPYLSILSIISTISDFATVIGGSTGVGAIIAVIIDVICGLLTVTISCFSDLSKDTPNTVYYNFDFNTISPLPAQFKRVEVVEGNGTIGKTIQEFTSDAPISSYSPAYAIWFPAPNLSFPARQRFAPWAYGLPLRTTVLDANGHKVKQTDNKYNFQFSVVDVIINSIKDNYEGSIRSTQLSCKCAVVQSTSQRNTDWNDPTKYNNRNSYKWFFQQVDASNNPIGGVENPNEMKIVPYAMYSGRTELLATDERIFDQNDDSKFVETETTYQYNADNNYEVNTITTRQSNGDWNSKTIKYSSDFTTGVLATLAQKNIVSLPVQTLTSVNSSVLAEKVIEFSQLANGDIKPSRILEKRFAKPVSIDAYTSYQGPGTNTSAYKINQQLTYNANGSLVGLKDEGGRVITNIYDYNEKYITASIINADPIADPSAYTSFETNSSGGIVYGGWVLNNNNPNTTPISAAGTDYIVTGNLAMVLTSDYNFHASTNSAKPYILSFWASNGNVTVNATGASLTKTGPTYNGYTYYEYEIAAGNSSVFVMNNTSTQVNIDELRLYPKNARMRTTTYDPLIGKTAECDENNRITYYYYDNLARLRFVKDEKKNIVKMYEYNNVSAIKQNGCPGTYGNNAITEYFRRSNCDAGYQGTDYPFSVPANSYTSTISQQDADDQAEMYLLKNGPLQAILYGSCQKIFINDPMSQTNVSANCAEGYKGSAVTYIVEGGKYTSLINVEDANRQALEDLNANAAAYANAPEHAACILNTDPDWTYLENAPKNCQSFGCESHLVVKETDLNPNSSTYNQTRDKDQGVNDACPLAQACNFTSQSGFTVSGGNMTRSGNNVEFSLNVNSTSSSTNWSALNTVANIDCVCVPSQTRQLTIQASGVVWKFLIDTQGNVKLQLFSGTPPPSNFQLQLTGIYTIN